jgi:hypothetical protein
MESKDCPNVELRPNIIDLEMPLGHSAFLWQRAPPCN